jgi:glycosyltransferase involved in cell wall biosynthesis
VNVLKTPLVSVVIPTYNHGHFLGRALQSVLDQTYTNWEAIVIDNHSTDNTDEIVQSFTDPRISLLKINNNGVIAASRNAGIVAAKGVWIAFLDSDDWWISDKLYECLKNQNDKVDFFYHDLKLIRESSSFFQMRIKKSRQLNKPILIDLLVGGNIISNSSVIVRKSLLEKINGIDESNDMIGCEDYNTWLRLAQITDAFYYVPKTLGYYLFHRSGISRKDMSVAMKYAITSFIPLLNCRQKNKVESLLKYTKARHAFLECNYSEIRQELLFCMAYASLSIKCKSIYMFISVFLKSKYGASH